MKKRFLLLSLLLAVCCLGPVLGQSPASAAADLAGDLPPGEPAHDQPAHRRLRRPGWGDPFLADRGGAALQRHPAF